MLILNYAFRGKTEKLDLLASVGCSHLPRGQWSQKGNQCASVSLTHTKDLLLNPVTTITTGWTVSACLILNFLETALRWWPCPEHGPFPKICMRVCSHLS